VKVEATLDAHIKNKEIHKATVKGGNV